MNYFIKRFANDEDGATLVEYGVALLVAIIVGGVALTSLASSTNVAMETGCDALRNTTADITWVGGENCN